MNEMGIYGRPERRHRGSLYVSSQWTSMTGALRPSLSHDIVKEEPTDGMLPVAILDLHEEVTDEQISDALSGLKNVR